MERIREAVSAPSDPAASLRRRLTTFVLVTGLMGLGAACTPTVQLQAPKEPITINLNIQADVRVRIEEAAQKDIESNPDIFGD